MEADHLDDLLMTQTGLGAARTREHLACTVFAATCDPIVPNQVGRVSTRVHNDA